MGQTTKRIEGYDVARALAIFGMIIVNFTIVMGSGEAGQDWLVFFVGLFEGRAVALFIMLAGVGLSLLSRRAYQSEESSARQQAIRRILKRALFLFVFGLMLLPIWSGDILHSYGVYMLIGAMLIFASDRHILLASVGFTIGFIGLFIMIDYSIGWDWEALTQTDFWTPFGLVRSLIYNGWRPVFPFVSFLLFGIWLGRQDIRIPQFRRMMIFASLVILLVVEILVMILISFSTPVLGSELSIFLFSRASMPPMPFYMLSAGSSSVIVIVLMTMLSERFNHTIGWRLLVVTGQSALTLYIAHIIVGMGIIEAFGWINGGQSLAVTLIYCFVFYAFCILFAQIWRLRFARGPFEWLMRAISR